MEPFIGTVIQFAGNFAPRGWAFCDGQLLAIASYNALFSILGTTYGGDGRSTFALPDLRGRVAMHPGNGPGLSSYNLGQKGGYEGVTLSSNQIPPLDDYIALQNSNSTAYSTTNKYFATNTNNKLYNSTPGGVASNAGILGHGGSGGPHENRQPYTCVNSIIALEGLYPSRS